MLKIMFDNELLNIVVFDEDNASDILAILKLCEIKAVEIYVCISSLIEVCQKLTKDKCRTFLGICTNIFRICDLRAYDIKQAIKYTNFNNGIVIREAIRYKVDYIVTNNIDDFNSTIKVINPSELRKILEYGKTN